MPHYSYEKTFKAGTSEDDQEELEMKCHWGVLFDVTISWRSGTDRQCHVHIDESIHQIYPTNPEGNYAYDGYTLSIRDEYELLPGTRKIYLRGWNTGSHPHTIAVAFRIRMPARLTKTEELLDRLLGLFELVIGRSPKSRISAKESE